MRPNFFFCFFVNLARRLFRIRKRPGECGAAVGYQFSIGIEATPRSSAHKNKYAEMPLFLCEVFKRRWRVITIFPFGKPLDAQV